MKTILYVDGYNLYYGLLKSTPYKWLDLVKLLGKIAHENTEDLELVSVKFFTAPIKVNFASNAGNSQKSQQDYHRALQTLYTEFSLILGYFDATEGWFPRHQKPVDRNDTVKAWKLEEKQTDVNIALDMYRDISNGKTEQVILVSNDSDLVPALKAIKEDFPSAIIGAIMPIIKRGTDKSRSPNASISKYTDWTRNHVNESELEKAQLPELIPTKKKPIRKPHYW